MMWAIHFIATPAHGDPPPEANGAGQGLEHSRGGSQMDSPLNDSACALPKHTPVRPTERRIPSSAVLLANACEVYWVPRSEVGVEYRPGGEGVITARHLQRVYDQVGSHVLGHRVADAGLGVAVDNGISYVESDGRLDRHQP